MRLSCLAHEGASVNRRQLLRRLVLIANGLTLLGSSRRPAPAQERRAVPTLSAQDLEDILAGSAYFGCGGGGSLADALVMIHTDLKAGLTFRMMQVDELGDGEYVAAAYGVGSQAPLPEGAVERHASRACTAPSLSSRSVSSNDILAGRSPESSSASSAPGVSPIRCPRRPAPGSRSWTPTRWAGPCRRSTSIRSWSPASPSCPRPQTHPSEIRSFLKRSRSRRGRRRSCASSPP